VNESHGHYAYEIHGAADEHHRHYDLEGLTEGLREDLGRAEARARELEDRCAALECQPAAQQAQYEADLAAADTAESGYGPGDESGPELWQGSDL
jgi:hypothetical protein